MRTGFMNVLVHRWPLAAALAVSIHLLVVGVGVAEEDHLKGYLIKDLNQVPAPDPVTLTHQFGNETCDLKKPQFFLVQSEKNGGDDLRGGPAGDFVCYKAKCTGALPLVTDAESQFGLHSLETKKAKLVCLPVNPYVCGDGEIDPVEQCDGALLGACALGCNPDCTCFLPACEATTGGFCWFATLDTPGGGPFTDCDTRCAQVGRVYDSATASYAGSGGTDANCQSVLDDLGVGSGPVLVLPAGGSGCFQSFSFGGPRVRSTDPTTATAVPPPPGGKRVCACQ